jgi:serine/threonine-protein kinase
VSDPLPSKIGPYRVLRRLGHGGMAEVFLANQYGASGFERKVALKVLLPPFRGTGRYERLLIEEAKLGALLRHRNLVQTYDLGAADGTYYACLEYVDGADLASIPRLPEPLAWLVAEEVALALEYVHAAEDDRGVPLGLVHRDVSPSNILVSRAGEVKLADFGIVKATNRVEQTRPNVRKGKYAYMSPEQVSNAPLSSSSDQFGFGVVLFELLTGARPFDGESVAETLDRIRKAEPPDLSRFAPAASSILGRCLAKAPLARFASAAELRRAVGQVRAGMPPVAPTDLGAHVTEKSG